MTFISPASSPYFSRSLQISKINSDVDLKRLSSMSSDSNILGDFWPIVWIRVWIFDFSFEGKDSKFTKSDVKIFTIEDFTAF